MANPADGGDDPDDILEGTSKPSTVDHATDPTYAYTPDIGAEAEDELVLSGSALLSSDIPIPARLGKYEIQGQIGRGGMGIVWKGFDPDLRRTVAIKVLSPHLAQSPVARRRFQREARAAAAINHENVLTIHSVEEQGETPFLVMEYVAGQSLKEYITERGKLGAIEVIRLSAQISQGLAAAHVQGVIHRDVKPANVMLHEGATRVRLMDFGLARVAFDNADLTSHDHAVGTPAYMAPEQIRGHDIDARADLFSLGCVMYCMVAGQSPFHGRNHAETIHKILDLVPARLHDVDPSVPVVLSEMVEKLLKKDPNERYQSAFEVAETLCRLLAQLNQTATAELGAVLSGLPPTTVASNDSKKLVKTSALPRSVVALLLVAATVVVTAGLTTGKFWPNSPKADSPSVGRPTTEVVGTRPSGAGVNPPPVSKLTKIVVGSGPDATCATLSEAIQRAAENCTITVVGPGPYVESVAVTGSALSGLTIKASSRAIWRCPAGDDGEKNALLLKDVSHVAVEGFDFEVASPSGRGILMVGTTADVTVDDCSFRHMLPEHKLSLVSIGSEIPEGWIRLRQCRLFAAQGSVMCLSISAERKPGVNVADQKSPGIECRECQFTAPNTHLYATQTCRKLTLVGNVFLGGQNAINLSLKTWEPDSRIEIVNNTFVGTRYWLGLMDSFRTGSVPTGQTDSRVCNNLILGGERVQGGNDQWEPTLSAWRFDANWWETDSTTKASPLWKGVDWNRRIADHHTRLDVPVRDDPSQANFLVPAAGSPLLTSGCGGDLPIYIGAKQQPASLKRVR
ncbi:MAG: serine/threonine-protein kinase [Planctomycetota bacterium]